MDTVAKQIIDHLPPTKSSILSFVGAGGKTTVIYHLAKEYLARSQTVLFTTTTKIFHPAFEGRKNQRLFVGPADSVLNTVMISKDLVIAASEEDKKNQKLIGFPPRFVDQIGNRKLFDIILVEADGSSQKPIKAPADHEPVVPDATDIAIGVIGLDCLGLPLNDSSVHRASIFSELTGVPIDGTIDSSACASLISSPQGLFKGIPQQSLKIVLLNKADDARGEEQGMLIADEVINQNRQMGLVDLIIICSFKTARFLAVKP
ncbi:putative selenium-dependent hydroxylase accessory protein YqeC [bacterium]|nr:putative selenium-dependent hydroxylase accessory protein YqeC [bacterium]